MRNRFFGLLIGLFLTCTILGAQVTTIKSGPMLGYLAMREVAVWVQTEKEVSVKMAYWTSGKELQKSFTPTVNTKHDDGFTARLIAGSLAINTSYNYELWIDNKPVKATFPQSFTTRDLFKWRKDAPDFNFAAGSCTYVNEPEFDRPGKGYGSDYKIFESMANDKPNFMIWLGDNIYLRETDWDSRSGIYHRNTHTRTIKDLQRFLTTSHHYAIWDDHDYGPNDSERSYYLKDVTLKAFKDFWANPNYGVGGSQGITGFFDWYDCDFYLMDDRWYRSPQGEDGEMLGKAQMDWLIESLRTSNARFKFISIGSQVLNSVRSSENLTMFPAERKRLLEALDKYNVKGVVFLTGDRHHSEVSKFVTEDGDTFYDFTVSPLTSGTGNNEKEANRNRVPNSFIGVHNYAIFKIVGSGKERKLKVTYKDTEGKVLKEWEIDN